MIASEFIYGEEAAIPSCHAASLAETGDGVLVAAWFGGTREGAGDVSIWLSRRVSGSWTAPVCAARDTEVPCWNPVLHPMRSGPLLLFYRVGPSPLAWTSMLRRSDDGGDTWSEPQQLPAGILGPIKNKPLELDDGTLVCGSSTESYRAWGCWVDRTPDGGHTWTKHGPINLPGHLYGIIQPAVFGAGDRSLAMLCRSRGVGRMARASSEDGGCTWTQASLIDLPQNNSGLDAVRLQDGRVLLIYNHATSERTPLNLAVSGDMGLTWRPGPVLESDPGEYSYPAIIQAREGTIHLAYTWNRRRIRYANLTPEDLPRV
jgi:predicted neuraminidase